jgi:predicted transcriptional regulator
MPATVEWFSYCNHHFLVMAYSGHMDGQTHITTQKRAIAMAASVTHPVSLIYDLSAIESFAPKILDAVREVTRMPRSANHTGHVAVITSNSIFRTIIHTAFKYIPAGWRQHMYSADSVEEAAEAIVNALQAKSG